MEKIEILDGIRWYLDAKNFAVERITSFVPPANSFDMRMFHSLYFVNLMSALDYLRDQKSDDGFTNSICANLITLEYPDGNQNYGYIRELRNAIVHRGLNINTSGHVVDGHVCVISPPLISDRTEKAHYTPFGKYLCNVIAVCEMTLSPLIFETLQRRGHLDAGSLEFDQNDAILRISASPDIPLWVKEMASKLFSSVDMTKLNEDLSQGMMKSVSPKTNSILLAMHNATRSSI